MCALGFDVLTGTSHISALEGGSRRLKKKALMFLTIVNDLTYEEVVFLSRNTTIKNTLPVNTENYVRE